MNWIQTFTGRKFYPLAPHADEVDIYDIAHALALSCRYNGHCTEFFSVAQHSVMVSYMVPECDALWGLLHDAAEAYVSDVVRPIKPYTAIGPIEDSLMQCIANKFGLSSPRPPSILTADLCCLERERRQLMPHAPDEWDTAKWWDGTTTPFDCWCWYRAEEAFLQRFYELSDAAVDTQNTIRKFKE